MNVDENYKWFEENYEDLKKRYKNKYLIIRNKTIEKACADFSDAVKYCKTFEPGTYIIQKCEKNKDDLVQVFHTRVRFDE